MDYVLHYAPDNASLIIRLALEHRGLGYETRLVDRASKAQESADFRVLNPNGQIPALETPHGPMFETGAILLWLADTHGGLGPMPDAPERAAFLKWFFFAANTLHPALRMMFYPEKYIATTQSSVLRAGLKKHLKKSFITYNEMAATSPSWLGGHVPTILDFYTVGLMRWPAIYPLGENHNWFSLSDYPALAKVCTQVENLPCTSTLKSAEGLGINPFTNPQIPNPTQGSAT